MVFLVEYLIEYLTNTDKLTHKAMGHWFESLAYFSQMFDTAFRALPPLCCR